MTNSELVITLRRLAQTDCSASKEPMMPVLAGACGEAATAITALVRQLAAQKAENERLRKRNANLKAAWEEVSGQNDANHQPAANYELLLEKLQGTPTSHGNCPVARKLDEQAREIEQLQADCAAYRRVIEYYADDTIPPDQVSRCPETTLAGLRFNCQQLIAKPSLGQARRGERRGHRSER